MRVDKGEDNRSPRGSRRARGALEALNFSMADMQAGIGPFLGVFLQDRGWATGAIGTVMTIGGIAGMVMTAPAGTLIDATRHKRRCVIVSGIFTVVASSLIWFSQAAWVVALSQVATAIAGEAIGPAVAGITLGIVRQAGFNRQNGRNQAWNHAGNMIGAGLSGFLGWKCGFGAVFVLAALFGVLAIVGDQIGYALGFWGGRPLVNRATARFGGAGKVEAAEAFSRKWAGPVSSSADGYSVRSGAGSM